ncbi:fam-a protein [Plasmodium vinckei lentum]|uniref:Fam-a protein n=1 Tax=Plasmodium vinckei lentum TaxID=138297 RepID=A0A6V7RS03_PLAVN|nr:fam-a protein [Plasmodium vinckei lentum]
MNKFYIQTALFLLSIFAYANNETLAAEPAPGEDTKPQLRSRYLTSEEIFEKNKNLLCTNPEETKQAVELMDEAVVCLVYHATNNDDSEPSKIDTGTSSLSYKKKYEKPKNLLKTNCRFYNFGLYNFIVNMTWDPEQVSFPINNSDITSKKKITRKVVRVYDPNLIIIQQRYKNSIFARWKYFYALAKKVELSEDKTIIVMASANINDQYPSDREYKNTIIENANLFKTAIESEEDIKQGKLKKVFVNIAGYLIENIENHIHITYIESINKEDST